MQKFAKFFLSQNLQSPARDILRKPCGDSLAWPDPFRAAAYRSEIISATLQGSGIVREHEIF